MKEEKRVWKVLGQKITYQLKDWLKENFKEGNELHIGTDSIQLKNHTQFITVVIIINPTKGGRVLYSRLITPRINALHQRLMREVWESVSLAMDLDIPTTAIHVDANPNENHLSSKYVKALAGMVVGNGFAVKIKPEAWAATAAADYVVRHHGLKRVK